MSLETWKKEFYPVTAEEVNASGTASVDELIEHSLRKWRGATFSNLERHDLRRESGRNCQMIYELGGENFSFAADNCALCERFLDDDCLGCPLVDDDGIMCNDYGRGYFKFAEQGQGPDLMIHELEEALEKWRKENA